MYIIHLVLMRLLGLVTFMPVNKQLVSEGNDGCLAEVLPPSSWDKHQSLVPRVCRVPLPHVDYRFLRDIFIPKHYFWKKEEFS